MKRFVHLFFVALLSAVLCSSCATWHQRTIAFQSEVEKGDFEQALKKLKADKKQQKGKNQILYYMNLGYVEFMLGHTAESNEAFETAEMLIEQQGNDLGMQAVALLSNPEVRSYRPEDFEVIMINFYRAMNYLQDNDMQAAMVEVRKINIKLNALNDKYPDHKNRYQRDAFAHLLMGLIYDAGGDYNNAFIAYRNAYETYVDDYQKYFNLSVPPQLKKDLMRTAYLCGLTSELKQYEQTFGVRYVHESPTEYGQLVTFWLNGLGPVKSEWSINFVQEKNTGGAVVFHNSEYGLSFPFAIPYNWGNDEKASLANIKTLRVAFPKYEERPLYYTQGVLSYKNTNYTFEVAEDINQIAFKTLHDRMLREFSTSLLRVATKKGVEYAATKQNKWVGLVVGLVNSATEKADTRNWQTLPYAVYYTRTPLQAVENTIELQFFSSQGQNTRQTLKVQGQKKKTIFSVYTTL